VVRTRGCAAHCKKRPCAADGHTSSAVATVAKRARTRRCRRPGRSRSIIACRSSTSNASLRSPSSLAMAAGDSAAMSAPGFDPELVGRAVLDAAVSASGSCRGCTSTGRHRRRIVRRVLVPLADATLQRGSLTVTCGKQLARRASSVCPPGAGRCRWLGGCWRVPWPQAQWSWSLGRATRSSGAPHAPEPLPVT
jgi:hypothetical protein